jgi:hypothetical protein
MRSRRTFVVLAALLLAACTSEPSGSDTSPAVTICEPSVTAQPDDQLPNLTNIDKAIAALELQFGGAQQYFEINATARVVNLFVALNDAKVAQPWLWVDGELSSTEGQAASGGTFAAVDMDYAPDKVLSQIRSKLPDAILESFYVNGDGTGSTLYGVLATAQCGGGLDIVVGPTGAVKSVDPVN